jgi:hypothetical protein
MVKGRRRNEFLRTEQEKEVVLDWGTYRSAPPMGNGQCAYERPKATNCGTAAARVGIKEWDIDRGVTRQTRQTDGPAIGFVGGDGMGWRGEEDGRREDDKKRERDGERESPSFYEKQRKQQEVCGGGVASTLSTNRHERNEVGAKDWPCRRSKENSTHHLPRGRDMYCTKLATLF